ncbi:hypothetical protein HLB23_04205 [Nocardia uniformis]|uniref:Uncharacterized protein n=1 Tax=Nocardia uniformis TaxID=53432 RepID=A0A849BQW7_9NOCA|nr:hypothetical protein [Nocardia uniformis]NNH69082.1 hypothetical protein [Nocardia uniformis]
MRLGSDRNKKNAVPADDSNAREATTQSAADDERLGTRTGNEAHTATDQPRSSVDTPVAGVDTPAGNRTDDRAVRETQRTERHGVVDETTANPAATVGDSVAPGRDSTGPRTQEPPRTEATAGALIADADIERFRIQWREVQGLFVDSPQDAVTRADELVDGAIRQLTEVYAHRKHDLESRWSEGGSADTEDLRQALRGYRAFFDQLLSTGR